MKIFEKLKSIIIAFLERLKIRIIAFIKRLKARIAAYIKRQYNRLAAYLDSVFTKYEYRAKIFWSGMESNPQRKHRFLILVISVLLFLDYLMFCYHTDKNIFNIFPSLPALDNREKRQVYIPDIDGKTILKETRKISVPEDTDEFVHVLFKIVSKGSIYENTSMAVPVDASIRRIWIIGDTCIIDVNLTALRENTSVIPGSEENFRKALEQTLSENIKSISKVVLLERGIPAKPIWEVAAKLP